MMRTLLLAGAAATMPLLATGTAEADILPIDSYATGSAAATGSTDKNGPLCTTAGSAIALLGTAGLTC